MKKVITLLATIGLALSMSFGVQADSYGNATKAGPLVNCMYGDGTSANIPTMVCTRNGGYFINNPSYPY